MKVQYKLSVVMNTASGQHKYIDGIYHSKAKLYKNVSELLDLSKVVGVTITKEDK